MSTDPSSLPARLKALPSYTPPVSGWSSLSARMAAKRRRSVAMGSGFALAASVVVAVSAALLKPALSPVAHAPVQVASAGRASEVAQLIDRSQALERELSSARPQVVVWNSGREARADAIEQRLRVIDAGLNYGGSDSAELWRERVKLMNALVQLHKPQEPGLMYASYQY